MRVSCIFLRQGVPLISSCEVLPCKEFVGRERDDKSCLCISLVLGLDGGGENWFVLKAGLVAAAAAQGAPPTMGLNGGNGGSATLCKYNVSNKTIIHETNCHIPEQGHHHVSSKCLNLFPI